MHFKQETKKLSIEVPSQKIYDQFIFIYASSCRHRFVKKTQETNGSFTSFGTGVTQVFWNNVKEFLVSWSLWPFPKNKCLLARERRLVSRCLLLAICWPYQRVTELTRVFFTKKCMAVLPGGQNKVLVITRWPYNRRGFHCTSIALEKCKKRMRYCSNYSGTTLLSIKKWNYSISWWIAFC